MPDMILYFTCCFRNFSKYLLQLTMLMLDVYMMRYRTNLPAADLRTSSARKVVPGEPSPHFERLYVDFVENPPYEIIRLITMESPGHSVTSRSTRNCGPGDPANLLARGGCRHSRHQCRARAMENDGGGRGSGVWINMRTRCAHHL